MHQHHPYVFYTFADYFTDVQFGVSPVTAVPVQHGVKAVCGAL